MIWDTKFKDFFLTADIILVLKKKSPTGVSDFKMK